MYSSRPWLRKTVIPECLNIDSQCLLVNQIIELNYRNDQTLTKVTYLYKTVYYDTLLYYKIHSTIDCTLLYIVLFYKVYSTIHCVPYFNKPHS